MSYIEILAIAVALSMDAFAVSVSTSASLKKIQIGHYIRFAPAFGGFQFLMPVLGWLLGISVVQYIEAFDHWIAFGLLALVGGNMIKEALSRDEETQSDKKDPTRGITLLILAVATSIDALAVGLSFSMIGVSVWKPALIIGIVCAAISAIGIKLGALLGNLKMLGEKAGLIGGIVLIGIGLKILFEHGVIG